MVQCDVCHQSRNWRPSQSLQGKTPLILLTAVWPNQSDVANWCVWWLAFEARDTHTGMLTSREASWFLWRFFFSLHKEFCWVLWHKEREKMAEGQVAMGTHNHKPLHPHTLFHCYGSKEARLPGRLWETGGNVRGTGGMRCLCEIAETKYYHHCIMPVMR